MPITTTSTLPAPVQQSFSMKLLAVPVPAMIHKICAVKKLMPRNGGTTLRMRRYAPLPTAKVPLGNTGVTPPPVNSTPVDIDAKMSFYGQYMLINEQVTLQSQDPVLNEFVDRLAISMRQTEDELTRDMLASTAGFINCTGGTNGDNPTEITRTDVGTVIQTLMNSNAKSIMDVVEAENKFGTAPIRRSYFAMTSTNLVKDLDQVPGWVHVSQYPNQGKTLPDEWGQIAGMRFLVSSIGSVSPLASNAGRDIYNIFVTGMEAYAAIEQDGYSAQFIYRPAIYSDPLAQNISVGWKMAECPRLLNDLWLINLRCTMAL